MPHRTALARRIKETAVARGLKQAPLARLMGVSRNAVNQWFSGGTQPSEDNVAKLAEILDVDLEWLRTGTAALSADNQKLISYEGGSQAQSGLLEPVRANIIEVDINLGAGSSGWPIAAHVHDENGVSFSGEPIREKWGLPPYFLREALKTTADQIRIFEVLGDSMEPRLTQGDRVFIDLRFTHPAPEGIFALHDGQGLVVKRLQIIHGSDPLKVRIISVNPAYPPYERTFDEVRIIGRLTGRFTIN